MTHIFRLAYLALIIVVLPHLSLICRADSHVIMDTKRARQDAPKTWQNIIPSQQTMSDRHPHARTFLDAEQVRFDRPTNTIIASGNVEISRGHITLYADQIHFNQTTNTILAQGNVRLKDQQGNLIFTKDFQLQGDLKTGAAEAVKGIMADDAIFAANRIKRNREDETQLDQVIYTPCHLCRVNPADQPTWAIQSRHMLIDHETGDIEHTDSFLQILGKRVAYVPYISHPGPTTKRRSGLLSPFFGGSGNLGLIFGISYYWAINPQSDLTITPVYTRENPLVIFQYRHAFCNGHWDLELSSTHSRFQTGPQNDLKNQNDFRGHISTRGQFKFDTPFFEETNVGFDINRSLDDTYLKKYTFLGLSGASYLTSRLYAEGFKDRSYFLTEGLNFQGLQQDDTQSRIPFIVPSLEWHYLSKPNAYQLTSYFDTSILNLQRRKGQNVKRLSVLTGLKRQWISAWGTVSDIGMEANFDYYRVSKALITPNNGDHSRLSPRLYGHIKYPLYKYFNSGRLVVEPIAGLVLTANNQNNTKIPDEDSFVELNDANIFEPNRFSGRDIMDQWSRVNYGMKVAFYSKLLGNSEVFIGQSMSLVTVKPLPTQNLDIAGIRSGASDLVVRGHYTYKDWLACSARLVLDKKNISAKRNESFISFGQPIFRVNMGYLKFPRPSFPGQSIEQVKYGFSTQFTPKWSLDGYISRERGSAGGALAQGAVLKYGDECLEFSTSLVKTFYKDRDYRPGTTIMFRFSFKNLGEVKFSPDRLGLGQALRD